MPGMTGMTGGSGTAAGADASAESGPAAAVRLQALLAQHTVLASDMMRARASRAPDFAQAAEVALTRNTQALSELLGPLLGPEGTRSFSSLWTDHIAQLFAYAEAAAAPAAQQQAAKGQARARFEALEKQLATLLAGASHGRLSTAAAQQGVTEHIDGLLAEADAFASGDYAKADAAYQHGYEHAFAMGGSLAAALLPRSDVASLATPGWQLRQGLTQLLGEHVALVIASMRAASGNHADFTALGSALNANTTAIAGAVGTLYGAAAGRGFQSLWADHVDALMAYTVASDRNDTQGTAAAEKRLRAFEPALAKLLDGATKSKIGAAALAHAFAMHDHLLVNEVTAYQSKDYSTAHDLGYQAYDEMFTVSGQLSHAISLSLAGAHPKGGSDTGGGGMRDAVERR
jgi:hypothetical protein